MIGMLSLLTRPRELRRRSVVARRLVLADRPRRDVVSTGRHDVAIVECVGASSES